MTWDERTHFEHAIKLRKLHKRELKFYKKIIYLLIFVSLISSCISIYYISDRVELINQIAEQSEINKNYRKEISEAYKKINSLEGNNYNDAE